MKKNGLIKLTAGDRVFQVVNVLVMLFLAGITLYPMLYVVFGSLSDPAELGKVTGLLFKPAGFTLEGYKAVLESDNVWIGYRNTLFYVVVGTVVNMVLTILGSYAMAKKNYLLKKPFIIMVMITMFFSGGMIPSFLVVRDLHMLNTVWAIIVPGAISTYNMIVLRTSFETIPESLVESAKMDGANDWTARPLSLTDVPAGAADSARPERPGLRGRADRQRRAVGYHAGGHQIRDGGGFHCADSDRLSLPAEILCERRHGRRRERIIP